MEYPIYIPTRGRFEKPLTFNWVKDIRFVKNIYIVVEEHDADNYRKHLNIEPLVLPKSNMGIAYARNFCKQHSRKNGDFAHWQFDDNIKSLMFRNKTKNVRSETPHVILDFVEHYMNEHSNIGGCGLKHHIFAFAAKNDIDINKQIYSACLFRNDVNANWENGIVEDTDYSLQILSRGFCTVLFNRYLIEKMATGVMKGGNTDTEYAGDNRLRRSRGLALKYPGHFQITEQYGRVKVKPSRIWNTFKQTPKKRNDHLADYMNKKTKIL